MYGGAHAFRGHPHTYKGYYVTKKGNWRYVPSVPPVPTSIFVGKILLLKTKCYYRLLTQG